MHFRSVPVVAALFLQAPTPITAQATLHGVVVNSATEKPLLGVLVVAVPNDLQARTSNDGRFVLGPLSTGQYELRLELHGFHSRAFDLAIDSSLLRTHDLGRIELVPAETLQVDIVGIVRDSATTAPVAGAIVSVNGAVSGVTLADGYFSATIALPVGPNTIDVRRIGYASESSDFWVNPTEPGLAFDIAVASLPVLEPVVVEADAPDPVGKLSLFYQHKRSEIGSFLEPEQVEAARRYSVTDILQIVPGVRVTPGTNTVRLSRAAPTPKCMREQPQFFLDGVPVRLGPSFGINDFVEQNDVVAVEVYNGPARIPVRYNIGNAACGVIALWTR